MSLMDAKALMTGLIALLTGLLLQVNYSIMLLYAPHNFYTSFTSLTMRNVFVNNRRIFY